MRIVVTGGTGFIGRHLTTELVQHGHEVIIVSRSRTALHPEAALVTWEQLRSGKNGLDECDGIVNLAGETINQRWTSAAKKRILQSRIDATNELVDWVQNLKQKPNVLVSGSGINAYGYSENLEMNESSSTGKEDFLSQVVTAWEAAADRLQDVRVVKLRTGVVLGRDGGALPSMALPYKLFAGGPVGSGRQWLSWIHVRDMVRAIRFCLENEALTGPVNAVSPEPVTNDTFGRTLGRVLHRPHWMPVPSFILRLAFGELSDLLLKGQRVQPSRLLASGFTYRFPDLQAALHDLYGPKE